MAEILFLSVFICVHPWLKSWVVFLFVRLILDFSRVTDKECSSIDNSSTANLNRGGKLYSIGEFDENCCTEKLLPDMANARYAGCGKRS
jgi:hypothetical protein